MAEDHGGETGPSHCEIVFTDSQGAILKVNRDSASPVMMAQGDILSQPLGICVGKSGEFFITDTGCNAVVALDPATGKQRLVSCRGILGMPIGIAMDHNGELLVANAMSVVRVNPDSGAQALATTGGLLRVPVAVAVAHNGDLLVVDLLGAVVRVDATTGTQTLVTSGGYLERPQGIAVKGHEAYLTDVATPDGNFGIGRIIKVDLNSGRQTVVSEGGNLVGPVGITFESGGRLVVADPYTINEASQELFDGGIILVDATTGSQTLLARGNGEFLNPRGVVVCK
jgi:sugar lactone lactonase YvrE